MKHDRTASPTREFVLRACEVLRAGFERRPEHGTEDPARAITFLVPHFNSPEFLELCLAAVRRFHPASRIVVTDATSAWDACADAKQICRRHGAELHVFLVRHKHTALLDYLMRQAQTPFALFLDQDCVLLDSVDALLERMGDVTLLAGPRDEMFLSHPNVETLRPDLCGGRLREHPECIHASLMAARPREIVRAFGAEPFRWTPELGERPLEKYYGLSQRLRSSRPESLLFLESVHTGYGFGMVYLFDGRPLAYHNWYSGRVAKGQAEIDSLDASWLRAEMERFFCDYADGSFVREIAAGRALGAHASH